MIKIFIAKGTGSISIFRYIVEHKHPHPQRSKNPNPQPKYKTNAEDRKVQQHNLQNKAHASMYLSPSCVTYFRVSRLSNPIIIARNEKEIIILRGLCFQSIGERRVSAYMPHSKWGINI